MRTHRGLTFVTVLLFLIVATAFYLLVAYGPAYWDNVEVKGILANAGNICYHEPNDEKIKDFVFKRLHEVFDQNVEDHGRIIQKMRIDAERDDLQIERSQIPPKVDIWLTYSRTVDLPLVNQRRTVTFTDHVMQDLSAVKW